MADGEEEEDNVLIFVSTIGDWWLGGIVGQWLFLFRSSVQSSHPTKSLFSPEAEAAIIAILSNPNPPIVKQALAQTHMLANSAIAGWLTTNLTTHADA
jgi:hypothetical protein